MKGKNWRRSNPQKDYEIKGIVWIHYVSGMPHPRLPQFVSSLDKQEMYPLRNRRMRRRVREIGDGAVGRNRQSIQIVRYEGFFGYITFQEMYPFKEGEGNGEGRHRKATSTISILLLCCTLLSLCIDKLDKFPPLMGVPLGYFEKFHLGVTHSQRA